MSTSIRSAVLVADAFTEHHLEPVDVDEEHEPRSWRRGEPVETGPRRSRNSTRLGQVPVSRRESPGAQPALPPRLRLVMSTNVTG